MTNQQKILEEFDEKFEGNIIVCVFEGESDSRVDTYRSQLLTNIEGIDV